MPFFLLLLLAAHHSSAAPRRLLHQPFFPPDSLPPALSPQPHQLPKLPFSSTSSSATPETPFFPSYPSPPPPSPTVYTSFPANISSLLVPRSPSPSHRRRHLLLALAVSVSLLCAALLFAVAALLLFLRRRPADKPASRPDSVRLYPPNTASSDGNEFLYLGTLARPSNASGAQSSPYQRLGSPELNPLPPLPKHNDDEEFFSPRGSSGRTATNVAGRSFQLSSDSSPASSVSSVKTNSPGKPKLKALQWDKVRSSSVRPVVWDHQLRSSSFLFETLFMGNKTNMKRSGKQQPNKPQNISILLRALHVTTEDVCQGLLEGNSDSLGAELLESLLKMAPTGDHKHGDKFLDSLLAIPFAFERVAALLYIANFDSEVDHLQRSFATLQVACGEVKGSGMLMKLLEAVLETGTRMNMATDTLLKLVDLKGSDGKTTVLHFVVQEMVRAEGLRLSATNHKGHSYEFTKVGLQVVSGLSGELSNVKKAATINPDLLTTQVAKLAAGIPHVPQVKDKFSLSIKEFLSRAEEEIRKLHAQEKLTLSLLTEITQYVQATLPTEEANNGFRVFTVVRDFLSILDQVCKQVGKINERSRLGLGPAPQQHGTS